MVTQAPPRSRVAIAVAFALSCVGLIIFVWTQFGGTVPLAPQGYRVKVVFNESGLLVPNADVRIAGVNVGKVSSVVPQQGGINSLVTMDIMQQYAPLAADTRAILRQKTLLGEAYITLSSGNGTGPKIPDGGTIPASQVEPVQALDQVLNSFDAKTQHNLQTFLNGVGNALKGRGQVLNDAFGNLDPAATQLNAVVGELNQQSGNVRALINNGATVLSTLGSRGADLQSLVNAGNSVFSATAAENAALTQTVDALPPFLAGLRTTLTTLNATFGIAKPSLDALKPVAPLLKPALVDLTTLSGPLLSLLRQAPPVLRAATTALPAIARFVTGFKPTVDTLLPAVQNVVPMIGILSQYSQEIGGGMANLAAATNATAPGNLQSAVQYLRVLIALGPDSVFGQSTRNPAMRSNAFYAPGELNNMKSGGLLSASCAGTSASGNVPCRVQPAYTWGNGISTSQYPHTVKSAAK